MTEPAAPPPPIPPEIFFKGIRSYRNPKTLGQLVAMALVATPPAGAVISHWLHPQTVKEPGPLLYFLAVLLSLPVVIVLSKCLRNAREIMGVDTTGVRWKHNRWYWPQIKGLKPAKVNFESKYYIRVDLNVDPRVCLLHPDTPLTAFQYAEFVTRLKPFLEANHPNVQLQMSV